MGSSTGTESWFVCTIGTGLGVMWGVVMIL